MLIRRAELAGRAPLDVRIDGDRIIAIGDRIDQRHGEEVLDAAGGALLPGLHDHHIHLFALAAAARSVRCGPPDARGIESLARALRAHAVADDEWLRGIGYHESVAGELDRDVLDRMVPDRPLRVQHRSGAAWFLNSRGIEVLGLDGSVDAPGVARDAAGRATGRLFRCDRLLRENVIGERFPTLGSASSQIASFGVTGVTDATPTNAAQEIRALTDASAAGDLLQRVVVMGARFAPPPDDRSITLGAVKIILDEYSLPALDDLAREIDHAHADGRPVAIHAVTRTELVLACGAFAAAGSQPGDRIEHAAILTPELAEWVVQLGLTVVTQPGFVRERGDSYLREVELADQAWLYRCRGVLDAGIPLGGGTDAPYGEPDPWLAMQAAVTRRTEAGVLLGEAEKLTPEQALALFTAAPESPGGAARRVEVGSVADLCLLDREWSRARDELSSATVAATIRAGRVVWRR
jgi:predicted amidohydrolase YtcJ